MRHREGGSRGRRRAEEREGTGALPEDEAALDPTEPSACRPTSKASGDGEERARVFLERNGRVSLRALQGEFGLDDEALGELRPEDPE